MPNNINPSQIVIDQPESSGQIQHGTATEPQQPEFQQLVVPRFGMAKGVSETRALLKEGGMMDEGGTTDPISGNDVPIGAMKEEVRDDVPAQLSEGEFVIPADVVRYIGLERLMMMRQAAKDGLKKMEEMGQMSNAEEATREDDSEFESEIDDILSELDKDEEVKMAEGGMVDPAMAPQSVPPAPATIQPTAPVPTTPDPAVEQTNAALANPQNEVTAPESGALEKDIIAQSIERDKYSDLEKGALDEFLKRTNPNNVVTLRQNDSLFLCLGITKTDLNVQAFSIDDPETFKESVSKFVSALKEAKITSIQGETKNPELLPALEAAGLKPEVKQVKDVTMYKAEVVPSITPAVG